MGIFLSFLLVGAIFTGIVLLGRHYKRQWLMTLDHMARTFGLDIDPGTFWRAAKAQGTVEGIPVVFDTYTVSTGKSSTTYTRITARPTYLPNDLTLKREGIGASLGKLFLGDDLAVGDDRFDAAVVVRGDASQARAVLDADTRRKVEAALGNGIVVEDGQVRWVKSSLVRDTALLERCMRQVVELARALNPGNLRDRLLQVVLNDPDVDVMEGALQAFLARWRTTPEEEAALLGHRRASVRLVVAPHLGERAWDVVVDLFDDVGQDTRTRVRALDVLQHIDAARAGQLALERIGRTQPTEVSVALLELMAFTSTCPPLADLAGLVAIRSEPLRLTLARCLIHSAEPAEAQLLELLADSDEDVACAAARGLARHGTPNAVTPLRERAQGFLVGGELKRAVEATIASIQSNIGHLGGSLSLLREQRVGGGLSLGRAEQVQEDE